MLKIEPRNKNQESRQKDAKKQYPLYLVSWFYSVLYFSLVSQI